MMPRRSRRIARSEVVTLSQYRSTGRKTSSSTSGGSSVARSAGTKPSRTPAASCMTGVGYLEPVGEAPLTSRAHPSTTTNSRAATMRLLTTGRTD